MDTELLIQFPGRSFCFTGKLADLKRTHAEREARSRGALTTKVVNAELDYLVVGSIPATGWKFGNYGTKIANAQALLLDGRERPRLVSESEFMDALARIPSSNSGAIDGKVIVVTSTFVTPGRNAFDRAGLEQVLARLKGELGAHTRVRVFTARMRNELFAGKGSTPIPDTYLVFEIRVVKHSPVDDSTAAFADAVAQLMEAVEGVDASLHFFERVEGSADYIRLIREVPEDLLIPDI